MDVAPNDHLTFMTVGVAAYLATHGIGSWKPDDAYSSDDVAIVLDETAPSPDRMIALAGYGVSDDPSMSDSVLGLQVTTRDTSTGKAIATDVFNLLHGAHDFRLPAPDGYEPDTGLWVVQLLRRSAVSGGRDENNRHRFIQNFYATVHLPSHHRT